MLPALWIDSAVPWKPKQLRNVLTSDAGVGASPRIATRWPPPRRPAACSASIPYALRIWFGKRPWLEVTADGKLVGAQPNDGVPVRVGVPPLVARGTRLALRAPSFVTTSPIPAIVSTLPLMPDGAFGVLAGSATAWLGCPVA